MTLGKPAVNLHEFELGGKSQPTSVGHAGQQSHFVGRQRPLVPKFDIDPGMGHVQLVAN